jgi:DNA-binding MarR family transcriptional regulator
MAILDQNIFRPSNEIRELLLLEALERNPIVSQRVLSQKVNIALGVTNACLKRMVRKGWVRMEGASRQKTGYYLTRRGLAEKTKLTLQLMSCTVQHYGELKKMISQKLSQMERDGMRRLVFYGVSDEMEVAYVTLQNFNLKLIGIVEDDGKFKPQILLGYEIEPVSRIRELNPDCILITCSADSHRRKENLRSILGQRRICTKEICPS